jgi:hypothetical protein
VAIIHIENRRLFEMAFGRLKPEQWEQDHLHECNVCQTVLHVFIASSSSIKESDKADKPDAPADAA